MFIGNSPVGNLTLHQGIQLRADKFRFFTRFIFVGAVGHSMYHLLERKKNGER